MNNDQHIYQVLDANLNRAREGLRVVEEVFRFTKKNKQVSQKIKDLRHKIIKASTGLPLSLDQVKLARNTVADVGRNTFSKSERSKKNTLELTIANLQRAQEALRVLEEFSKLVDGKTSFRFKKLRFETYQLEVELLKQLN